MYIMCMYANRSREITICACVKKFLVSARCFLRASRRSIKLSHFSSTVCRRLRTLSASDRALCTSWSAVRIRRRIVSWISCSTMQSDAIPHLYTTVSALQPKNIGIRMSKIQISLESRVLRILIWSFFNESKIKLRLESMLKLMHLEKTSSAMLTYQYATINLSISIYVHMYTQVCKHSCMPDFL